MRIKWKERVKMSKRYKRQWMPLQTSLPKKCGVLFVSVMLLLTGCATAPKECPRIPEFTARVPAEPNYLIRTQDFLSGKLPELMKQQSH